MKFKKIIALIVVVAFVYSCSNSDQNEKTAIEISSENLTIADYAIDGMVCAMGCAATIEKDIAALTGVVNANVDYEAGKAHFEFDEAVISEKEIITKIENIADGQYKVKEWVEEKNDEEVIEPDDVETSEESEGVLTNVSLPSFKIPNLFTLLLDQI